jgi:hypothetical protein
LQRRKINSNGFSSTFTIWQIIPFIYSSVALTAFVLNLINTFIHKIYVVILVCLAMLAMYFFIGWFWYKATSIDPTDEIQLLHRNYKSKQI